MMHEDRQEQRRRRWIFISTAILMGLSMTLMLSRCTKRYPMGSLGGQLQGIAGTVSGAKF